MADLRTAGVMTGCLAGVLGLAWAAGRRSSSASETMKPTAVIIKGNPKYIRSNPDADRFYEELSAHLRDNGYDVSFDAGKPYTTPPLADLWVGHSRGADRLRFAPETTQTVAIGSPGGICHPEDNAQTLTAAPPKGYIPNKHHYTLTDEMRRAMRRPLP
jgi:hypothetical protein